MNIRFISLLLTSLCCWTLLLAQEAPRKVSTNEALKAVQNKVQPDYPPTARQLKIEGTVEVEAVITESGAVEKVNIVSGNPVLTKPAAEAVKHWKFTPFTDGGKAVRAIAPLTFTFKL